MRDVAVERGEIGVSVHHAEQVGTHADEIAGAARRAVEPTDQLLPARFRGEMQRARVLVGRLCAPFLDRLREPFPVRAEIAHQSLEEGAASCRIQLLVDVEHFTRHGGAGGFAAARQQRAAQLDQPVGILFGIGRIAAQQRPAALGDGSKQIGEEGVSHLGLSKPGLCGAEAYTGFRPKPITIKRRCWQL